MTDDDYEASSGLSAGGTDAERASMMELKNALRASMEARGVIDDMKAQLRAQIFGALNASDATKPKMANGTLILNELIREYLEFNGYKHTLSVFLPEAGQPSDRPFPRSFLSQQLEIRETPTTRKLPLLYSFLSPMEKATTVQMAGTAQSAAAPGAPRTRGSEDHEDDDDNTDEDDDEAERPEDAWGSTLDDSTLNGSSAGWAVAHTGGASASRSQAAGRQQATLSTLTSDSDDEEHERHLEQERAARQARLAEALGTSTWTGSQQRSVG